MRQNDFDEISVQEVVRLIKSSWLLLLVGFIFGCAGTIVQYLIQPHYSAQSSFVIEVSDSNPFSMMTAKLNGLTGGGKKSEKLQPYIDYLESAELKRAIAQKLFELGDKELIEGLNTSSNSIGSRITRYFSTASTNSYHEREWDVDAIQRLLSHKIAIYRGKKGNIAITVRSLSPRTSINVANLILDNATETVLAHELKDLDEANQYLQNQVHDVEAKIRKIQNQISTIKQTFAKSARGTTGTELVKAMSTIKAKIMAANTELVHTQELIKRLESQNQDYIGRNRLLRLKREEEFIVSRIDALKKVQSKLIASSNAMPNIEGSVQDLMHEKEFQYRYSGELKKQMIQLGVQRISIKNRIRDVRVASNDSVYKRNIPYFKMFLSCVIVFLLVISISWFRQHMAVSVVESKRDLTRMGFRYMGNLPNLLQSRIQELMAMAERKSESDKRDYPDIFQKKESIPEYNESQSHIFASVRSKIIHFMDFKEKELKTLVVASPKQGDGKTFIAGRLATVFSQMEMKVLLVDADMMKRDLSKSLGQNECEGLAQVLAGEMGTDEVIVQHEYYKNLHILPAGRPPKFKSDLIMNGRFAPMIQQLNEEFDLVVIDTPALLLAHDAIVPMKTAHFILMSITEGKTAIEDIEKMEEELHVVPKAEMGFLLNRSARMGEYYYYGEDSRKAG